MFYPNSLWYQIAAMRLDHLQAREPSLSGRQLRRSAARQTQTIPQPACLDRSSDASATRAASSSSVCDRCWPTTHFEIYSMPSMMKATMLTLMSMMSMMRMISESRSPMTMIHRDWAERSQCHATHAETTTRLATLCRIASHLSSQQWYVLPIQ